MRRHLEQMSRYMPLDGSLLEVGCAYGLFLDEAALHFIQTAGERVEVAEERLIGVGRLLPRGCKA